MKAVKPSPSDAQLSLDGIEAAQPTDRLFFAIFPDPDTASSIAALVQALHCEHELHGKPLRPERFHVTLHHLGDYVGLPQDVVASAKEVSNRVKGPMFDVAFDSVLSFEDALAITPSS